MTTNDHDPRDAPGGLARSVRAHPLPPELEDRVVASLEARGLLAPTIGTRWRPWRGLGMLAAAALLFIAGGLAERARTAASGAATPTSDDGTPRFALLLYGGPTGTTPAEEAALVAEYGGWARELAMQGREVSGEKLGDAAIELGPRDPSAPDQPLAGFFIIGAASAEEAEALARSMPHIRYGGRVVVRPIDPT